MRVTTVIPAFNAQRFLPFTLEALARQTRRPDKIVLLDNCSTDETVAIARNFGGLNVEIRCNESNVGLVENFNRALSFANETDFLHLQTADDLIHPEFYEKLVPTLPNETTGIAYAGHELITSDGKVVDFDPVKHSPKGAAHVSKKRFLSRQCTLNSVLLPGLILKTGRRPVPCRFREMRQFTDSVFLSEWAAVAEKIMELGECLSQQRIHQWSVSRENTTRLGEWVLDEWRAMQLISALIEEPAAARFLRRQKLLCLFAARSQVKMEMVRESEPAYAAQIHRTTLEITGRLRFNAASQIVRLRNRLDRMRGRPTKAERLNTLLNR